MSQIKMGEKCITFTSLYLPIYSEKKIYTRETSKRVSMYIHEYERLTVGKST